MLRKSGCVLYSVGGGPRDVESSVQHVCIQRVWYPVRVTVGWGHCMTDRLPWLMFSVICLCQAAVRSLDLLPAASVQGVPGIG